MTADRPARPRSAGLILGALAALGPLACDQPTGSTRPRSKAPAPTVADTAPTPAPVPEPTPPASSGPILGRKTMEVRDAAVETRPGGGATAVAAPKITSRDPITLPGNAYVSIVGQNSILNIKHGLDLYQAETGEYPRTYDEFMEKIIRGNNIALPALPPYQKYGYDAPSHSLVILEYPELKGPR